MRKAYSQLFCWLFGLGVLLSSCSKKEEIINEAGLVTHNDFENVLGWGGTADASISRERAHSGKYALRVGPDNEFAYNYTQTLGQLSPAKVKSITVSGWVWLPSAQAAGSLVVSISHSPEQNTRVFYADMPLATKVKRFSEWQQVSQTFTLPDSVAANNLLKCYLWRAWSTVPLYADDLTIRITN